MLACKRCHGYINLTYREFSDPSCINCGCLYPELGTSANGTKKSKGLREPIRYTGNISHMKNLIGYITYAQHPNKGSLYPMLIVECPICMKKAESTNTLTNPYALNNQTKAFVDGYKIAKQFINCPAGHSFRLKVNEDGMYSWQ